VQHRAREREARPHPRRIAAHPLLERMCDAKALGSVRDPLVRAPAVHLEERSRVLQVVVPGQTVVERGARGHHAAKAAHLGAVVVARWFEAERGHVSRIGAQRARHETHDGRLARAVRAEQHRHCPARDVEGQVVHGDDVAERAPDARERDCRATSIERHARSSARERPE